MGNKLSLAKLPFAKPFTSLESVTQRLNLTFTEPDYEPETVANILRVLNDGPDQPDYYTENIILLEVVGYYNCFIALTRNGNALERAIKMGSVNAIASLGLYYVQNKTNYDKGISLIMQAVERGHVTAMHNLVLIYTAKLEYDRVIKERLATTSCTEPEDKIFTEDPIIKFINEHLDLLDVVPTGKSVSSNAYIAKAVFYKVICNDMVKYNECIEAGLAHNSMQCRLAFSRNCLVAEDEVGYMGTTTELIESGNIQAMYNMCDYYISKNDEQKALEYLKMIWDIDPYYNLRSICGCHHCMRMRIQNNGITISYHNKLINIPKLMAITPVKLVQLCVNAGHEYLGIHTPGTQALYKRLTEPRIIEEPEIQEPDNTICPDCQKVLDPANMQISKCNKYKKCTECFVKSADNMYCCRPCYMKDTDAHKQLIKDVTQFINSPELANQLCYWSDIGAWEDGFIPPESGMEYPLPVNSQIRSLVKYTASTSSFKVRLDHIKKCLGMSGMDELADDIKHIMQKIRAQLAETFCSCTRYSNFYIDNTYIGIVELIDCFGKDAYYHIIDIQGHALFDSFINFEKHMITDPETNKYIDTVITKGETDRVRINNNANLYKAYSIRHFKLDITAT